VLVQPLQFIQEDNGPVGHFGVAYRNLTTAPLIEHAVHNAEGILSQHGSLVVHTGRHTGRSPNDKYIVRDSLTERTVWWGKVNRPMDPQDFDGLLARVQDFLRRRDVYIQDCYAGADLRYRLPIRVIAERAWHALFARNLFIIPTTAEQQNFIPDFTVIHAPGFRANPEVDRTISPTFIVINFTRKIVLIGGTEYAGEIKKAVFTILNYLLPQRGIFSMHCSANYGPGSKSDAAIFFGLSGTGKTTLSADPNRILVGDDEHGWSNTGIFNFEGGCYAKVIHLSSESEPEIYAKTRHFGTILENVVIDTQDRSIDLLDARITENTRAAYSIETVSNADVSGMCGHPRHIVFLTADAFGVLPPVAKLTPQQAMYYFISGYTAKVSGTEHNVVEPSATFSACFGAPFLPLHPLEYADLLSEKMRRHHAQVWLVNTGWTGGPYGVGRRISLRHTRSIVTAILRGGLDETATCEDNLFGLHIPTQVPNTPVEILIPRDTWEDRHAYDQKACELAWRFKENFTQYADQAAPEVVAAGPKM
jgi:phosphoenolpyruvate carboxykinase (ATP)